MQLVSTCFQTAHILVMPFALSVLIVGCATPDVDATYRLTPASTEGVVTGSVTYKGSFSGYGVHYKQIDGTAQGRFANHHSHYAVYAPRGDFSTEDYAGVVFAVPLPAGEYEMHEWSIGSGFTTVLSTTPFSIRFKVEPGKMVYAGNFHFTQTTSRGLTVTGARLTYKEAMDRDLPLLKKKFTNLADIPIAYSIAPATQLEDLGGAESRNIQHPIPIFLKF